MKITDLTDLKHFLFQTYPTMHYLLLMADGEIKSSHHISKS